MKVIDIKPGDIVIWFVTDKTPSWLSKAIAWLCPRIHEGGQVGAPSASHSGVVAFIKDGMIWVYESTWPKTRLAPIPAKDYEHYHLVVYRKEETTDAQRNMILNWCDNHLEEWYDIFELLTLGFYNNKKLRACSEFCRDAYAFAGMTLGRKTDRLVSPNEIVYETPGLIKAEILS